jgi:hypothetical protein
VIQQIACTAVRDHSTRAGGVLDGKLLHVGSRITKVQTAVYRHTATVPQDGLFLL